MIGRIIRVAGSKITTRLESISDELLMQRQIIEGWQDRKLGLDEYPASAQARLEVGNEITALKRLLLESRAYKILTDSDADRVSV